MFPRRRDFLERTLAHLAGTMELAARADTAGAAPGTLQAIDPRVKGLGFLALICAAAASQRIGVTGTLFGVAVLLAAVSGRAVWRSLFPLWGSLFLLTGAAVLPAIFLTPGPEVFHLPWIGWAVTQPGLHSAAALIARSETTATLATLLVLTTPWAALLKALRVLRVPSLFILILGMTYRFVFVLLEIARAFFEARRVRQVGRLSDQQRRQMAISSAAILLSKSVQLNGEIYEAMLARGACGDVRTLDTFCMHRRDWAALVLFGALAAAAFAMGMR